MYTKKQEEIAKEYVSKERKKQMNKKPTRFTEVKTVKIADLTLEEATKQYGEVGAEMWANAKYGWKSKREEKKYFGGQGTF